MLCSAAASCQRTAPGGPAGQPLAGVTVDAAPASPTAAVPAVPPGLPQAPTQAGLALPPGHPPIAAAPPAVDIPDSLSPADLRVADLTAQAKSLDGQQRTVRGVVVKVNHAILERNWVHVEDRTGKVVVTTTADPPRGAVVSVRGTVSADQDIGAGYRYPVLVRDATVTVEKQP